MALRACAPANVFTDAAKESYLSQVAGNAELTALASTLFSDDSGFVHSLPDDVRAQLLALVRMAYDKGIRKRDRRV